MSNKLPSSTAPPPIDLGTTLTNIEADDSDSDNPKPEPIDENDLYAQARLKEQKRLQANQERVAQAQQLDLGEDDEDSEDGAAVEEAEEEEEHVSTDEDEFFKDKNNKHSVICNALDVREYDTSLESKKDPHAFELLALGSTKRGSVREALTQHSQGGDVKWHTVKSKDDMFTWDLVLVFKRTGPNHYDEASAMSQMAQKMQKAGLKFMFFKSRFVAEHAFCVVGATEDRLKQEADRVEYPLRLSTKGLIKTGTKQGLWLTKVIESEDNWARFIRESDLQHMYGPFSEDESKQSLYRRIQNEGDPNHPFTPFMSVDRLKLTHSILVTDPASGGAGFPIDGYVRDEEHPLESVFALHGQIEKRALERHWFRGCFCMKLFSQPLEEVRSYLGEDIAFYFAFLQFYNTALLPLALLGAVAFYFQVRQGEIDTIWIPALALVTCIWSTLLIEQWKRKEAIYRAQWGMQKATGAEMEKAAYVQHQLPSFKGELRWSPVTGMPQRTSPIEIQLKNKFFSKGVILALILCVCGLVAAQFSARQRILEQEPTYGGIIAGILTALFINIMNYVYNAVALKLTDYENHPTKEEYDSALIANSFVFKFVNNYASLFYIAFIQLYDENGIDCGNDSCLGELREQLATIMLFQIIIGNIMELRPGFVQQRAINRAVEEREQYAKDRGQSFGRREEHIMQTEIQYLLPTYPASHMQYPGTFEDMDETVIQFGYVILFIVVFPLTPVIALLANWMEFKIDAEKMMNLSRRPMPQSASGLGSWVAMMTIMGFVAVVTNIALVVMHTSVVRDIGFSDSDEDRWLVFVAVEHALILLKFAIDYFTPDEPVEVQIHLARQKYLTDALIRGIDVNDEILEAKVKQVIYHIAPQSRPPTGLEQLRRDMKRRRETNAAYRKRRRQLINKRNQLDNSDEDENEDDEKSRTSSKGRASRRPSGRAARLVNRRERESRFSRRE